MNRARAPLPEIAAVTIFVGCAAAGGVLTADVDAPGALLFGTLVGEILGVVAGPIAASALIRGQFFSKALTVHRDRPQGRRRWLDVHTVYLDELPPEERAHIARLGRIVGILGLLMTAPLLIGRFAGVFPLDRMSAFSTFTMCFALVTSCIAIARPKGLRRRKRDQRSDSAEAP